MRRVGLAAVACLWLAAPLGAQQERTSRFELTEQFIRETWLYPLRAVNVTVLGEGPVHNPTDDCEIHIGAELKDSTISELCEHRPRAAERLQGRAPFLSGQMAGVLRDSQRPGLCRGGLHPRLAGAPDRRIAAVESGPLHGTPPDAQPSV